MKILSNPLKTISQLQDPKYTLTQSDYDVQAIKEHIGENAEDYDGFLVEILDGDYGEIWGFTGTTPYLSKLAYRLQ